MILNWRVDLSFLILLCCCWIELMILSWEDIYVSFY